MLAPNLPNEYTITIIMHAKEAKEIEVPRSELLYNKGRLLDLHEQYGDPTEIKKHVKTNAFIHEIRTALVYWTDGKSNYRTNTAIWERLRWFDQQGKTPEECAEL